MTKFEVLVQIAKKLGVTFYTDKDVSDAQKRLKNGTQEEINKAAREKALAIVFFMNSNDAKYRVLKQESHNAIAKEVNSYQMTIAQAHNELVGY